MSVPDNVCGTLSGETQRLGLSSWTQQTARIGSRAWLVDLTQISSEDFWVAGRQMRIRTIFLVKRIRPIFGTLDSADSESWKDLGKLSGSRYGTWNVITLVSSYRNCNIVYSYTKTFLVTWTLNIRLTFGLVNFGLLGLGHSFDLISVWQWSWLISIYFDRDHLVSDITFIRKALK